MRRASRASSRRAGCASCARNHPCASTGASHPGDTLARPLGLRGSSGPAADVRSADSGGEQSLNEGEAADESGSPPAPEAPRPPKRVRGARPALGRCARRPEPGHCPAGRGGRGQDGTWSKIHLRSFAQVPGTDRWGHGRSDRFGCCTSVLHIRAVLTSQMSTNGTHGSGGDRCTRSLAAQITE